MQTDFVYYTKKKRKTCLKFYRNNDKACRQKKKKNVICECKMSLKIVLFFHYFVVARITECGYSFILC